MPPRPLTYRRVLEPLTDHVGPGKNNQKQDKDKVLQGLWRSGHEPAKSLEVGLPDNALHDSIGAFQGKQGLTQDRWVAPEGPTYRTLNAIAGGFHKGDPAAPDRVTWLKRHFLPGDHVGIVDQNNTPARNDEKDRLAVARALGLYLPLKRFGQSQLDRPPTPKELAEQIKQFQAIEGLPQTGWIGPGTDSLARLIQRLEPWVKDLPKGDAGEHLAITNPKRDVARLKWLALDEEREAGAKAPPRKTQVQVKRQPEADAVTQDPGVQRQPPHNFHTPATTPAEKKAPPDTKTATTQDGVTLGLLPAQTALLTSLGTAERDDLSQLTAEIRRLWKDDPQKAEALIKDLTLHLTLVDPERPQEYITTAEILQARTRLQEELESTQEAYELARNAAQIKDAAEAADKAQLQEEEHFAPWQPVQDDEGDVIAGLRTDPKTGDVVLWDESRSSPVRDSDGGLVAWDQEKLAGATPQDLADLGSMTASITALQYLAQDDDVSHNRGVMQAEIQELKALFRHYTRAEDLIESLENQIDAGSVGFDDFKETSVALLGLVTDPSLPSKLREIDAYYEKNGSPSDLFAKLNTLGDQISDAQADIASVSQTIALLSRERPLAEDSYLAKQLLKASESYVAAMAELQSIGTTPYPELDTQLRDWASQAEFRGKVGATFLSMLGSVVVGAAWGFAASVGFGAAWAGYETLASETEAGLAAVFDAADVDRTDAKAVAAFAQKNVKLFADVHRIALIKSLVAAGNSAAADVLAHGLFGDVFLVEDIAAWSFEKLLDGLVDPTTPLKK